MPLPIPKPQESKAKFLQRCLSDETLKSEFPQRNQAVAICAAQYRKK